MKQSPADVADRLEAFTELLRERAAPIGIVSEADAARLRERHVDDSLRALDCLGTARSVADIGSGGGLPGIPVAIARSDIDVVLLEPRRKRAAFLELCVDVLELTNVRVVPRRASVAGTIVDVSMTRAVGTAWRSWSLAEPVLSPSGYLVYFAGRSWSGRDQRALIGHGLHVEICAPASFPWQGPLVKIGREDQDRPAG